MRILILCFLIPACFAFDFDCLKGPVFWCASFANAQKCHKITECFMKTKTENQLNINVDKENSCEICLKVVGFVESKFQGFTEQQLISSLDSVVCDHLKGELKPKCKSLIKLYGPFIYQLLQNFNNPQQICQLLTVCKSNEAVSYLRLFDKFNNKLGNNETCAKCKEVFSILQSLFDKITPDEIKFFLDTLVCGQLPSELQSMCKMLVDGYSSQLYELIKSLLDGDRLCPMFHFCAAAHVHDNLDVWSCQTCLDVVPVLRKDLINVSEGDLGNFATNMVCSKMSIIVRGVCNDYVNSLVPIFYNDIHSSLTPEQICNKNKICASPTKKAVKITSGTSMRCEICEMTLAELKKLMSNTNNVERLKSFAKSKICGHLNESLKTKCSNAIDNYGDLVIHFIIENMNSHEICETIHACTLGSTSRINGAQNIKGIECEGCKLFVARFKQFISDPTRETFIKNFVKNRICTAVPSVKFQCQQAVDEYFDIILNFIISELDADTICHIAGVCPTVKSNSECAMCEVLMSEVISLITTDHSQQVITNFVTSDICSHLGPLGKECVVMAKTYLPILFQLARSDLNTKLLCSELHLCSSTFEEKMRLIIKHAPSNALTCDVCKFVVNESQHILTDPTLQSDIENFLKNAICPHFKTDKDKCVNDINQYFSLVVNIIVEFLNPSLCSELGLCNSTFVHRKPKQPLLNIIKSQQTTHGCSLCNKFYNYLKNINEQSGNTNVVLGLVQLCNEMDPHEKSKCLKQFKNFDAVIKSFNKSKNLHQFCKMTKMCMKNGKHNLGEKACSWGPGFWCISREHALGCGPGAVKHCEMSVWSKIPVL